MKSNGYKTGLFLTLLMMVLLVGTIFCNRLYAQTQAAGNQEAEIEDFSESDEDLADFEETIPDLSKETVSESSTSSSKKTICLTLPFDLSGDLRIGTTYNFAHTAPPDNTTDWRSFSRLRPEINLEIRDTLLSDRIRYVVSGYAFYDTIYRIRGKAEFTPETLEENEAEAELGRTYVQAKLHDAVDLKIGRQVVVWGKSDMIRVVDIINPLCLREPGLTDIEDLRMPLFMTRVDTYLHQWHLSTLLIHEIRFDKQPAWGSDYYPTENRLPYEIQPDSSLDHTEFGLMLAKTIQNVDFSFYFATVYNDAFHLESVVDSSPARYDPHLEHSRIKMYGGDINIALGNWLLKSEIAYLLDIAYYQPADSAGAQVTRGPRRLYNRYDTLIGLEYMGIDDTVINIDAVVRYIPDYDTLLEDFAWAPDQTESQWAARISRDFWNETLTLELFLSVYDWTGDDGALERLTAAYDVTDTIQTRMGVALYQSGERTGLERIGDDDRIFLDLIYSF